MISERASTGYPEGACHALTIRIILDGNLRMILHFYKEVELYLETILEVIFVFLLHSKLFGGVMCN